MSHLQSRNLPDRLPLRKPVLSDNFTARTPVPSFLRAPFWEQFAIAHLTPIQHLDSCLLSQRATYAERDTLAEMEAEQAQEIADRRGQSAGF